MVKKITLSRYMCLIAILTMFIGGTYFGKSAIPSKFLLANSNLGKEFWVAIPPNSSTNDNMQDIGMEILVTSPYNTVVTLEIPMLGVIRTKTVEAYKLVSFSSQKGELTYTLEVRESDQVSNKGIKLSAPHPISVYVISAKQYSGEGYMAVPTDYWGKEYIHNAYWDFVEQNMYRGGGFIVIARENNTTLTIKINGRGKEYASCEGGKNIGDEFTVTLDAGQTYMLRGNGKTRGQYDISGTKITSTKPVGVISFHMRTMIPSFASIDRDMLCEMLAPVSAWGKQFITVQYPREKKGNATGEGDLFRIVASQDNTAFHVDFYTIDGTMTKIGQRDYTLQKAGDFMEVDDIRQIIDPNSQKSIRGLSVWTATKPVMLMQYAFSSVWDNDNRYGPQMLLLSPTNQYARSAIFQTPLECDFRNNVLTIFALGDPNDPNYTLLKTVKVNGTPLHELSNRFLTNLVPGTNYYWARLDIQEGVYYIESETFVNAYLNGYNAYNSYVWPAGMAFNKVDEYDVQPPVVTYTSMCGNYTFEATELKNDPVGTNPRQIDQGISKIIFLEELSYNYTFSLENPSLFPPITNKITKHKFYGKIIDPLLPGKLVYGVLDRAGNLTLDSVIYIPNKLSFAQEKLDFGPTKSYEKKQQEIKIYNNSPVEIYIRKMYLKNSNSPFAIISNMPLPKLVSIGDSVTVELEFTSIPKIEVIFDIDTLIIETDCITYAIELTGSTILPKIAVADFDFGRVEVGTKVCIEDINGKGLKIQNVGTDTLTIFNISTIEPPFITSTNFTPEFPFDINPQEEVHLKSICFVPSDTLQHTIEVTLTSNGFGIDSTAIITGKGFIKEPQNIPENNTPNLLSIYPNPINENLFYITYNLNKPAFITCELYNELGTKIKTLTNKYELPGTHINSFSTAKLSNGIYFIRWSDGNNTFIEKIILNR